MKILALDTSSTACSAALMVDDVIFSHHEIAPMQQAQRILTVIEELLLSANSKINQLDAIAFGCGPGSFTGIRIAVSVAQGLAYAAGLPVIAVSSLAALAQSAYDDLGWKHLLVGVDARINEVYWGAYQVGLDELVCSAGKEVVCSPQQITLPNMIDPWCGVGNAWDVYRDRLPFQPQQVDASRLPTALAVLKLAQAKYLKKEWVSAMEAAPVYLRDQVAFKSGSSK